MLRKCAFLVVLAVAWTGVNSWGEPRITTLEIVSKNAADDDSGNAWGGHQSRIVRTAEGIFTAYTVSGKGYLAKEWRLMERHNGEWRVLASGLAGREPVNLLAAPDGTLHVIGWPEGQGTIWSGKPRDGKIEMQASPICGLSRGDWPYGSAGIDCQGNLCILSSEGVKPGAFRWAFCHAGRSDWTVRTTPIDYRYCYTYVIPHASGGIALVSSRDVTWQILGYQQPNGSSNFVFSAFRFWETSDVSKTPLQEMATVEEKPSEEYPSVFCSGQYDAYFDTEDRMHVLFRIHGPSTRGKQQLRHVIFSRDGKKMHEKELPPETGIFCRIFQDDRNVFWILGSAGQIYPLGRDGLFLGQRTTLDLQGHTVEYSGFGLSVPRTGTPLGQFIDAVFPSEKGTHWIYCRILLYDDEGEKALSDAPDVRGTSCSK